MEHRVLSPRWLLAGLVFTIVSLAGCDSPSPRMRGAAAQTVEVAGSTFGVHWLGSEVEIYRTSMEFMPRLGEVMAKAEQAVEIATGCRVVPGSLKGDAALMVARIDC